jgi:hypothetical protein
MTDHKFVSLHDLLHILILIERMPNAREQPLLGDLEGTYDRWFDGGAVRYETGITHYDFNDGTKAKTPVLMRLSIGVHFPNGVSVSIHQNED